MLDFDLVYLITLSDPQNLHLIGFFFVDDEDEDDDGVVVVGILLYLSPSISQLFILVYLFIYSCIYLVDKPN